MLGEVKSVRNRLVEVRMVFWMPPESPKASKTIKQAKTNKKQFCSSKLLTTRRSQFVSKQVGVISPALSLVKKRLERQPVE